MLTCSSRGRPVKRLARPAGRTGRGLGPLYGTPTSNLVAGQCPEGALPLQTRSACRPEGPATPVAIIMGVFLSPPPSNPLGLLASPMSHMSPPSTPWVLGPEQGKSSAPWTTAPPTVLGRWTAYGSAVPHLARSSLFRDDRSQERQAPRPACAGCALLLSQACATMIGLSDWPPVSGRPPPLCTLR